MKRWRKQPWCEGLQVAGIGARQEKLRERERELSCCDPSGQWRAGEQLLCDLRLTARLESWYSVEAC